MLRHLAIRRAIVAILVAAGGVLAPGVASGAADNSLGGQVFCDLDTGLMQASWVYTNNRGPAQLVDVAVTPSQWQPQITTDVRSARP